MNAPPQTQQALALGPRHFDLLMSAIAAQGAQRQHGQLMQGHGIGGGMNGVMQTTGNGNIGKAPAETANVLDQIFGHSGFSRAMSTAQNTPPNQLTTPLFEMMLQNLLSSAAAGNNVSPDLASAQHNAPAHIQQTRSGRISRPPVPASMGQNDILRVLSLLNQPGMEVVRTAMDSAGLLEAYAHAAQAQGQTQQADSDEAEAARSRAMGQALQLLMAQSGAQVGNVAPPVNIVDSGVSVPNGNGEANIDSSRGTKRSRKQLSESQQDNLHMELQHPTAPHGPPRGKGSRLAMSKDEILFRRRERNKASALASRMKKQGALDETTEALRAKEEEVGTLTKRCEQLERELEAVRQVVLSAGLAMPASESYSATPSPVVPGPSAQAPPPLPTATTVPSTTMSGNHTPAEPAHAPVPTTPFNPLPFSFPFAAYPPLPSQLTPNMQFDPNGQFNPTLGLGLGLGYDAPAYTPATTTGTMDTGADPILDFNMFMNMDNMDDEADGDFEPETSPQRGSDSEGEGEDDETTPRRKRAKRHAPHTDQDQGVTPAETDADADAEAEANDEDFIDPEMEDEDLFLPIEDVPIPESYEYHPPPYPHPHPAAGGPGTAGADVTGDLMKALKVDTRDQLAAVMQKLVDSATAAEAGDGGAGGGLVGVAPEVVDKLRNVIMMAQAQSLGQAKPAQAQGLGSEKRTDSSAERMR